LFASQHADKRHIFLLERDYEAANPSAVEAIVIGMVNETVRKGFLDSDRINSASYSVKSALLVAVVMAQRDLL
jgi:hypothetical protein